ncbi:MAG: hypothetical protein IPL35_16810 [Sphingobacteriales bacterium]|nr:hypothetical protein [Sphingobacteriales bacterium]
MIFIPVSPLFVLPTKFELYAPSCFLLLLSLWRAFFLPLAFAQNETTKSVVVGSYSQSACYARCDVFFYRQSFAESEEQTITELQSDNYFYFTQAVQTMNFVHLQYGGETMDFFVGLRSS